MCGIVAEVSKNPPVREEPLRTACRRLGHRGPDGSRIWLSADKRVGLGAARLAVRDLSAAGDMPMVPTGSEEVCLVFNGEIYNAKDLRARCRETGYRFRGHSDTEVLLASYLAWGTKCVRRLDGMFAFVLYDERSSAGKKGRVLMARDRAGEKPLYYRLENGALQVASEPKALLALSSQAPRISLSALNTYLSLGYLPGEASLFQGIKRLPASHALTLDLGTERTEKWSYWSLPSAPEGELHEENSLVDEFETVLEDSVARSLVADVPVAVMLSGGIDSSLVTAMAARHSPDPVQTYTVSFPGEGRYDEAPHARKVAAHFGTDHHVLEADPADFSLLRDLIDYFDEPLADPSIVPTFLVARACSQKVKVAVGGDGGDELFGGYGAYSRRLLQHRLRRFLPENLRKIGARWIGALPPGVKGRQFLLQTLSDPGVMSRWRLFDPMARSRLLTQEVRDRIRSDSVSERVFSRQVPSNRTSETDLVEWMTRTDFRTYLPDDVLLKVDRASMAVSLEVRAPFLTRRVLEFAYGRVPARLKCDGGRRKILPRRLGRRVLPDDLDLERKQGFSVPASWWHGEEWRKFSASVLGRMDYDLFEREQVTALIDGLRGGRSNSTRLFALVMFQLWRERYGVAL